MTKIIVSLPQDLLNIINQTSKELKTSRSKLFREAIIRYLSEIKQKRLEALMAEGYEEMAEENLSDACAFLGATKSLAEQENV